MKKFYFFLITMLVWPWYLQGQGHESYIPANLGRIVEVATPVGVLTQPRVLIGWEENGFVKQANSTDTYKIFGVVPYSTALNTSGFNHNGFFGAPSGHDALEIRFGDSCHYWAGTQRANNKLPFSVYNIGPKAAHNPAITGGIRLCIRVIDQNNNKLFDAGERIEIYGDLALPMDSTYADVGTKTVFPFSTDQRYLRDLRFGRATVSYSSTSFTPSTDGFLPPAGTVIRFVPQTTDSTRPYFTMIESVIQDSTAQTHSHQIPFYSFEQPRFELLQGPPRMQVDSTGRLIWTVFSYQIGNQYAYSIKAINSAGSTVRHGMIKVVSLLPADTGTVEYPTQTSNNRIRFWQRNDGSIGYRASQSNFGMEYPKGSGYSLNYAGGIYIGGIKRGAGGVPDTIAVSNYEFSGEFQPGRILNSGPFGNLFSEDYRTIQTFFSLPENAHNWPVGAPKNQLGQALQLSGKDTWTVFNDINLSLHRSDGQDPSLFSPGLGIEVQRQTFQFEHYPFNNTVLVRYIIINRTNRSYDSCYVGFWNDPDVGGEYSSDLADSDSARSLIITYNNASDLSNTAAGMQILQGPITVGTATDTATFITIKSTGFEKSRMNGKKILTATSAYSIPKPTGSPDRLSGDITRYHYLRGFDLYGNAKPLGPFDVGPSGRNFGDQRTIIATGPFLFVPGDTQEVWMAYIGGQGVDNTSAVDTVRRYAQRILNDFKNNQIYQFDKSAPVLSLRGLSTQAVNRVRFVVYTNEPLLQLSLTASGMALPLQPFRNGYAADYNITAAGTIPLILTGKDLAGNTATVNKTYQVASLNKPVKYGSYTFQSVGSGYLLTSTGEVKNIPENCMLIGEPVEWLATENGGQTKIEFAYTNSDLVRIQNRYDEFDMMNLGLYAWNGEEWEAVETTVSSNKLSGMAKGTAMAVFYNPDGNNVPQRFALEANYPNPFNPVTTIRYQIPAAQKVTLKIYNLLGQEVRTLVNSQQSAGIYSVVWDGKDNFGQRVTSGIYLYRLEAGEFVKTRKMILVK